MIIANFSMLILMTNDKQQIILSVANQNSETDGKTVNLNFPAKTAYRYETLDDIICIEIRFLFLERQ